MNPTVISTIIAAASFILTIFTAIYLNQRHVDKLVEQLDKRFETRISGLEQTMNARFDTMNARFDYMDKQLKAVDSRLDRLEGVLFKPAYPGN